MIQWGDGKTIEDPVGASRGIGVRGIGVRPI